MDGWSPVNINVKVHINLFFVLFFLCVYCVALFLKVYWKAFLALFQLLDLEKKKHKQNSTDRMKIIILHFQP